MKNKQKQRSKNELEKYGYDDILKKRMNNLKINDTELMLARVTEVQKEQYNIIRMRELGLWAVLNLLNGRI